MEKDFCIGLLMGLVGGCLICANSYKARRAVKEGQEQIIDMLNGMECKKCQDKESEQFTNKTTD